jgi:hypothetical protein
MHLAYYIRLDSPPKGINHAQKFEGKTAAKNWEKLTAAAKDMDITPLQDFVSLGKADLATILGKKAVGTTVVIRKERWFPPQVALSTIRKLMSRIASEKTAFEQPRMLIRDLQAYENILTAADARGSRFHFSPDLEEEEAS